ncbi:KpsF/GutQ family sugar-phosphate isomerase [Sphingomonas bacterium]|uniref:KpsF/GutQ family sugar-phosphate isomerase n=1 Tax=Sphingomonas bacterium TaxID=1895847 RepID=UPI0020C65FDE|nr:KpsF/GutQ family sugar-phosphate isomerase [Sphingomonas bacterium]
MHHDRPDAYQISEAEAVVSARTTIRIERDALAALEAALDAPALRDGFARAFDAVLATRGRTIVTGMGKSGLVARKIAATLMSTGTPAAFLHPGEASHGDLGMITRDDVVLALSWSGETPELAEIVHHVRRLGVTLIVMTSRVDSAAGQAADICLPLPAVREACPHQLAPTASTTVQAALGDALAMALIHRREFSLGDFHQLHPGGRLGARLATVAQVMGRGEATPVIAAHATLIEATVEMSRKRYGCTAVVDEAGRLVGVFTDGDLRRSFATRRMDVAVGEHMTLTPLSVPPHTLASDALRIMNDHAVTTLFVCEDAVLLGVVHLHDVLRAGAG